MSVLKGFGLWLARSLLIFSVIASILLAGAVHLTSADFVEDVVGEVIEEQIAGDQAEVDENYQRFLELCKTQSTITIPTEVEGIALNFDCQDIEDGGKEGLVESAKKQLVEQVVAQSDTGEVSCEGFGCLTALTEVTDPQEALSIVTSQEFNKSIKNLSTIFLVLAIISAIGILLLATGIAGRFLDLGYPLVIAGLPFLGVGTIKSALTKAVPSNLLFAVEEFTSLLSTRYLTVFIVGIVLLVVGLVLKYGLKIDQKGMAKSKKK